MILCIFAFLSLLKLPLTQSVLLHSRGDDMQEELLENESSSDSSIERKKKSGILEKLFIFTQ